MNVLVFARPLALAAALALPASGGAEPAEAQPAEAPPADAPPHLIRLDGSGAHVIRDGVATSLEQGDPVLFGDRLELGQSYGQVLWGDGSRVALDRGAAVEVLAVDLLALTAGRALVSRPAATTMPLRVDTPAASVDLSPGGEYRFSLDGGVTSLAVTSGRADVSTGMGNQVVAAGYQVALRDGIAPESPRRFNAASSDRFIAWATTPSSAPGHGAPLETFEDPRFEAYSDVFNRYGAWETDPQYGAVWYPTVATDWRPYTAGYWQAYGPERQWLWVGRDPFGWPTHHFGRWGVNHGGRWYWMPGRQWAPAWVGWSVGPGHIGWSPLGNHDRPVQGWDTLSQPRGVYPGWTLDPSRAWTVVPSDRFGQRGHMGAYAVDPHTLDNLSAFVSQRVGPSARYRDPAGRYGGPGGTTAYGPGSYYGGARSRSRGSVRGGIGPTRVGPPAPGYGGPSPAPDDPYERAQQAVAPRSRQHPAQSGTSAPAQASPPAQSPAPPAPAAPRQRTPPPREAPPAAPPPAARETAPPSSTAEPPPAPPAGESAPPASTGRASGTSTGRRAAPRP